MTSDSRDRKSRPACAVVQMLVNQRGERKFARNRDRAVSSSANESQKRADRNDVVEKAVVFDAPFYAPARLFGS